MKCVERARSLLGVSVLLGACASTPATPEARFAKNVKEATTDVKRCVASALRRDRDLKGQLLVAFDLDRAGSSGPLEFSGSFKSDELSPGWVEACIQRRSAKWAFTVPPRAPYRVEIPIKVTKYSSNPILLSSGRIARPPDPPIIRRR